VGPHAAVTPLGQLPFLIEFLKQAGLFDGWVAGCPVQYTTPNAPSKRDPLGTVLFVHFVWALALRPHHRRVAG